MWAKKTQNKGYYAVQGHPKSSKVIKVGTNRKPVCNFLLVINSNWHSISYRFGDIAAYVQILDTLRFRAPPLGLRFNVRKRYDVHLGLIGKRVVDLLLVITELFARCYGWGATSEKRSKIGDFAPTRSVWPKISGKRGSYSPIIFDCHKTLPLTVFTWINFVADFLQAKCDFRGKKAVLRFWAPLGDLGATYDDHLRLIGKRVVDFLFVLIELTAEALRANIGSKSAISLQRGPFDPKFRVEAVAPTNHSSSQKTRLNVLSHGIKIWTDFSVVM